MSETESHKRAKKMAAGKTGEIEVKLPDGRRIDAVKKGRATEIERSGTEDGLLKAAKRLQDSGKAQKILQVPQKDMDKALEAMEKKGVAGTVKNMSGTKKIAVKAKK